MFLKFVIIDGEIIVKISRGIRYQIRTASQYTFPCNFEDVK